MSCGYTYAGIINNLEKADFTQKFLMLLRTKPNCSQTIPCRYTHVLKHRRTDIPMQGSQQKRYFFVMYHV